MNSKSAHDESPYLAQRRRRDDGPPVVGSDPIVRRRTRLRYGSCIAAQTLRGPVHGQRHQSAELVGERRRRRHGVGRSLEPLLRFGRASMSSPDYSIARHGRRHSSRPDRQYSVRGGAAERVRAARRHQHGSGTGRHISRTTRRNRAWCWAASSRSRAITRRISRWPTARTSPGRTPTRRCRWRSIHRWPSTAFSTIRAAGEPSAFSTAFVSRHRRCNGRSALRQGQAGRVFIQRA